MIYLAECLTYENWGEPIFDDRSDYYEVLKWAFQEYGDDIVYACSFGAEGIVLIDLIYKINKRAKIKFLDTGLHFEETYELIEQVKDRYPSLQIEMVTPELSLEEQSELHGEKLWAQTPNLCCHLRKVIPLEKALKGSKAWISGLRRDQSPTRKTTQYINKDEKFKKIKICPLIHWTWDDILSYIHLNHLPYNPLHDEGYPSIGCAPCTRPVNHSGNLREGRWAGLNKIECGLHLEN